MAGAAPFGTAPLLLQRMVDELMQSSQDPAISSSWIWGLIPCFQSLLKSWRIRRRVGDFSHILLIAAQSRRSVSLGTVGVQVKVFKYGLRQIVAVLHVLLECSSFRRKLPSNVV